MIFRADDDVAGPRRQLHGLAFGQRLLGKGVIAFMQQGLQQRVLRVVAFAAPLRPVYRRGLHVRNLV
jgi:hypothetical protein